MHLCFPTLKIVPPQTRRLLVKQMIHTWTKTLLHFGYKYLLNLLVTLVVTYKAKCISYLSFLVKSLSFFNYRTIYS